MYDLAKRGMEYALHEAKKALEKNCVPIGAIIMLNNKIIAKAHNGLKQEKLAHAEILCINKALKKLAKNNEYALKDAIIFVTIEPCAMCIHAIKLARIGKVIFGAGNKNEPLPEVEIIEGIAETEAITLMQEFFNAKR